jgi:hypothetical protein
VARKNKVLGLLGWDVEDKDGTLRDADSRRRTAPQRARALCQIAYG